MEQSASPTDTRPSDERKQSPPAFLDLADSVCLALASSVTVADSYGQTFFVQAARLGSNMPDISAVSSVCLANARTVADCSVNLSSTAGRTKTHGARTSACSAAKIV